MSYLVLKWLHVVNATVLVGFGLGSAFYFFVSARRYLHDHVAAPMLHVARWVVRSDAWVIAPSVFIQPLTGWLLIREFGWSWQQAVQTDWLWLGLAFYAIAGAAWLPVLWMQIRMRDLVQIGQTQAVRISEFRHWFRWWTALGVIAFISMAIVYALMIVRPTELIG